MKSESLHPPDRDSARSPVQDNGRPPVAEIERQLGRILDSEPFLHSERLRRFLDFIVRRALQSDQASVKQFSIAIHVFDRDSSFDPETDPIVRVEAGRLRAKLREYYSTAGARDPVWIGLPNRGYIPIFKSHLQARETACLGSIPEPAVAPGSALFPQDSDTVGVLPFADLSRTRTFGYFCDALTHQIIQALLNQAHLKVAARSSVFRYQDCSQNLRDIGRNMEVATVLEGSVQRMGSSLRISALLADTETGRHLWANVYDRALDDVFAIQDEISALIAHELRDTIFQNRAA